MEKGLAQELAKTRQSAQEIAETMITARKELNSFQAAIRGMNSGFNISKELERHTQMMKTINQPFEEMRQLTNPASAINDHMKSISLAAQAIKDLEKSFALPKIGELESIFKQIKTPSISSSIQNFIDEQNSIKEAMSSMSKPWLNTADIARSVVGFSELQTIGSIVRNSQTFDDRIADVLRIDLGDWRELIVWPESIFEDPAVRTSFYEGQGLNLALTEFPTEAFYEGLSIAGLRGEEQPKEPEENEFFDEDGLLRTNQAHDRFQRFEITIRRFIEKQMIAAYGPHWLKQQVPGEIHKCWQEKQEKALDSGEPSRPLIEYADFTDYMPIIIRKDNWNRIFKPIFKRPALVQESFQRLYPIRICTMHARIITQDDELYLCAETTRLLRAIGNMH